MIIATMTDHEIRDEVFSEIDSINKYIDNKNNYYRRTVIKSKTFPLYFQPVEYTTPKKNKYLLIYEARGKDYPDDLKASCVCLYNQGGMNAITLGLRKQNYTAFLFSAHLFARYRKRFLQDETLSNLDVIKHFFIKNKEIVFNSTYSDFSNGGKLIGTTREGVIFGVQKEYNIFVLKTFFSFNMLKKWQNMSIESAFKYLSFIDKNSMWGYDK